MAARITAWLLLAGQSLCADAQIRILAPASLAGHYRFTNGRIEGSTTTIGAPFYGDRVLGQLVYSHSESAHCNDDYKVPGAVSSGGSAEVSLIKIVMVRRGHCSFLSKVRLAYTKGAHAVVIVDKDDSKLKRADMKNVIVHEDGFANGNDVHIPSVFISKDDGNNLIRAIRGQADVVVELAWDLPTNHTVKLDMWMSSASGPSAKFLKEFAPTRKALNWVMSFQPHYAVFGVESAMSAMSMDLCSDATASYCAEDPDGPGPITGRDVIEEDVRQLCIHELYKVVQPALAVEYAQKYWDYMERFSETCLIDKPDAAVQSRFGKECSTGLMQTVGIDVNAIEDCFGRTKNEKLKYELDHTAWSPRAMRINGWRFSGIHDPDLVTQAICAGFINQPPECTQLLSQRHRDPFKVYIPSNTAQGMSFGSYLLVCCFMAASVLAILVFYKRYLGKGMRASITEKVRLEVQARMGEYGKLRG